MEKLACLGLLDPGCKTENVYVQLLETINKKEFTARSITVTIVDALSDIVYVAKSKKDQAPKTLLTKRQFAHVLGYICNRDLTLGEVQDSVVRNVWNPRKMEKQLATNPNALWDGVKFFGVKTTQLDGDNDHGDTGEGSSQNDGQSGVVAGPSHLPLSTHLPIFQLPCFALHCIAFHCIALHCIACTSIKGNIRYLSSSMFNLS